MSVQSIAAAISESGPESGQKNRSGPNFQFLSVPAAGNTIASYFTGISGASGITATLIHDKGGANDEVVAALTQNGTFSADKVQTGANYYIASPDNAADNFVVYFQGNV